MFSSRYEFDKLDSADHEINLLVNRIIFEFIGEPPPPVHRLKQRILYGPSFNRFFISARIIVVPSFISMYFTALKIKRFQFLAVRYVKRLHVRNKNKYFSLSL